MTNTIIRFRVTDGPVGNLKLRATPFISYICEYLNALNNQTASAHKLLAEWQKQQQDSNKQTFIKSFADFVGNGACWIYSEAVQFADVDMQRPKISEQNRELSQWLENNKNIVYATNPYNTYIQHDPLGHAILLLCDGEHTIIDIHRAIFSAAKEGHLIIQDKDGNEIDDAKLEIVLKNNIDDALNMLKYIGLLI